MMLDQIISVFQCDSVSALLSLQFFSMLYLCMRQVLQEENGQLDVRFFGEHDR